MRFNKITFDNYRCFLNGTIEFPKSKDKSLTILVAPNGGGKTETLFAFWWCLYDFDFSKLQNKENTPYALNSTQYRELDNSPIGSIKNCSVSIDLEENGIDYVIAKKCEYRKTEKGIIEEEKREFSRYNTNGELGLPERDPDEINKQLNRIIPRSVLSGILFDGERMQKLNSADENSINAIKGVITNITNVELLEKCDSYFASIKSSISKELKKKETKHGKASLQNILDNLESREKKKEHDELELTDKQDRLATINVRLSTISQLLEKNKEVREIEEKRKQLRGDLAKEESHLDNYYKDFSACLKDAYILAGEKLLNDVDNIIQKYDVPQDLTVPAVKNILTRPNCICGRPMDEHSIKCLQDLILSLPPDNINSTLAEIVRQKRLGIDDARNQTKRAFSNIQSSEGIIKQIKDDIVSLSTQISSLSDNANEEILQAIELEDENKNLLIEKGAIETFIPQLSRSVDELNKEIKQLREARDDLAKNSTLTATINKQITYIEKCIFALERIKDINKESALYDINEKLSDAYMKLSEDADRDRKIKIIQHNEKKKYRIAVYMKEDLDKQIQKWRETGEYQNMVANGLSESEIEEEAIIKCMDSSSTGQSKINTFAFVKAILDYSNSQKDDEGIEIQKEYPLLIDAPFGDIASGNLEKSSRELHNFANQVILMIDDDKYKSLKEAFEPFTNSIYVFSKADKSNYSTISKVRI